MIKCLPLNKGLNKDFLSYFSGSHIESGSLIKINIKGKNNHALVISSENAKDLKTEIKSANFKLKKVETITSRPFLKKEFLNAVIKTAEFFVTSPGSVLSQVIPSTILENQNLLLRFSKAESGVEITKGRCLKMAIQDAKEERMGYYKSLIREEFAKRNSVFICLPQNENIRQIKEFLEKGIEKYIAIFHKEMSKKDFKEEWKKVSNPKHPVVIIGTPRWLFIPRKDLKTIIIENENGDGWKTLNKPFIDLRFFTEKFSEENKSNLIFGDTFLRIDTLYRHKIREIEKFEQIKWRLNIKEDIFVIDPTDIKNKDKEFKALSPIVIRAIRENIEQKISVLVYTTRKGLSPITICGDCGQYTLCSNCKSPMVLYGSEKGNYFKCNQCGEIRGANETCIKCGSWKLTDLGIGAEKVIKELSIEFPQTYIFELNKDLKNTNQKVKKAVEDFFENKGSILVASDMVFSYLNKKVGMIIIASLDSLFEIPDFRIREKIFRIMLQCRNSAKGPLIIQSRNKEDVSIKSIQDGNLVEFYNLEINERKVLGYPPFGLFIKITYRGNTYQTKKETERMQKIFQDKQDIDVSIFNSTHEKKGEQSAVNAIFKITREDWPDKEISNFLRSLPNYYEIKIDPDNLL